MKDINTYPKKKKKKSDSNRKMNLPEDEKQRLADYRKKCEMRKNKSAL